MGAEMLKRIGLNDHAWIRSSRCVSGGCVEVTLSQSGAVLVRNSMRPDGPVLGFSAEGWTRFMAALKAGEFR
jgi:hypothetical protein